MVGMEMRTDQTPDRLAVEPGFEHAFPLGLGFVAREAGIDDRPGRTFVDQPDIDVIGRERQRQPHPFDAGRK